MKRYRLHRAETRDIIYSAHLVQKCCPSYVPAEQSGQDVMCLQEVCVHALEG
jgi:hypothetical protein